MVPTRLEKPLFRIAEQDFVVGVQAAQKHEFVGIVRTPFWNYVGNYSHSLRSLGGCKGQSPAWSKDLARCMGIRPMGNLSESSGYVASTLVLLTFVAKDMGVLRAVAILSNLGDACNAALNALWKAMRAKPGALTQM
jgi:hypothetical protein